MELYDVWRALLALLAVCSLPADVCAKGGRGGGRAGSRGSFFGSGGASLSRPSGVSGSSGGSTGVLSLFNRSPSATAWGSVRTSDAFKAFALGAPVGRLSGRSTRPYYYSRERRDQFHDEEQVCWFEADGAMDMRLRATGRGGYQSSNTTGYYYFICEGTCCDVDCCRFDWAALFGCLLMAGVSGCPLCCCCCAVCRPRDREGTCATADGTGGAVTLVGYTMPHSADCGDVRKPPGYEPPPAYHYCL